MLEEVSESMLAQLLGPGVAEDGMEWLSTLSFVERHRDAVRVHTLVRDAVFARMLERSPGRLADVLEATSRLVMDALKRSPDPEAMLRAARMFIDLGRFDPEVRRNYLASDAGPECTVRPAGKKDFASIVEMVRVHEGDASAAIAETWLERPETSAWLVDDGSNAPAGCIVTLRVGIRDRDASARDPVVAGMFGHLEATGRALEGDALLVHRFLLSAKDHQAPTAVTKACHGVMLVELVRNGTRTDPAHHVFTVYSEADLWEPAARSASLTRLREREVTIGGRRYTPFYLSLREMPVDVWLANVARQLLETVRGRSPSN